MFATALQSILASVGPSLAALVLWAGKSLFLGGWFLARWITWLSWPLWTSIVALGAAAGILRG
ncbi:MAG: hypothetical protein EBU59_08910 [Planctomycetia bacterium]|nr:hypothetical protein [Planctomycetia bacterium]